ncbi:cilia- and flagella-associated protein 119 isoform X2 [Microcaecilia unicolor]|uniref:Coiled-coil domain-containing protein 189 isoform X2 n=1 Tax=Microcaecilia unicolor TaxID=1415580 RepID=A0A6P7YG15_9AMPH|nr:coiled-coil domain-containing protein 189 isoform X2 [Microcaecilia unicolor]
MATEWERLWPTKVHRARICLWRDLSMQQLEVIGKAQTGEELKRVLAELFSLTWAEIDQRSAILLELYYYTVLFCREQGFSDAQTSCLFSIIKETHEFCIETPLGNIEQCYNYFTELLLCHTVRRPPFSTDIFSLDQVPLITNYVLNTYFRHFKLYKYVFTSQVRLDISLSYCGLSESKIQLKRNVSVEPGFDDSSSPREKEQATAVAEEAAEEDESPMAPLKNYIKAQLALEVSQLLSIVEEKLLASEHNFSSKLALLEEPSSTKKSHGGSKGKRK